MRFDRARLWKGETIWFHLWRGLWQRLYFKLFDNDPAFRLGGGRNVSLLDFVSVRIVDFNRRIGVCAICLRAQSLVICALRCLF